MARIRTHSRSLHTACAKIDFKSFRISIQDKMFRYCTELYLRFGKGNPAAGLWIGAESLNSFRSIDLYHNLSDAHGTHATFPLETPGGVSRPLTIRKDKRILAGPCPWGGVFPAGTRRDDFLCLRVRSLRPSSNEQTEGSKLGCAVTSNTSTSGSSRDWRGESSDEAGKRSTQAWLTWRRREVEASRPTGSLSGVRGRPALGDMAGLSLGATDFDGD